VSAAELLAPEGVAEGAVTIVPVASRAELIRFIELPARLHAHDPNWVKPLRMERLEALSPKKNPYFQHAEAAFWLAVRDGRDVGRISAQIDRLSLETHKNAAGHFGMIAAEDDPAIFKALFDTAEAWLRARGMKRVLGPFNLSINEETGLLVDGFDTPPMLMMPHDLPHVGRRVEEQGYAKAKDTFAYLYDIDVEMSRGVQALLKRRRGDNVTLRHLSFKRYAQDIRDLTAIFNEAWTDNWGFVPLTEAETAHMAKALRPLIHEKLVWFVDVDGEPAAFGVCVPNLNEAIRDLDGGLFPFGWAKLLWRLRMRNGVRTGRVPLMGVRRKYAGTWLGSVMPFMVVDAMRRNARDHGLKTMELGWILEDNMPMRAMLDSINSRPYKTQRVYVKDLV
jgi:hypothetical protein